MSMSTSVNGRPLCVDLDGTLVSTDVLWESLLIQLKTKPLSLLLIPLWIWKGKAFFKRQLAQRIMPDPATLPYREELLSFLRKEKALGREIILATASDRHVAESIANRLGIFSTVLASNGKVNLSGQEKLKAIKRHVGTQGFTLCQA